MVYLDFEETQFECEPMLYMLKWILLYAQHIWSEPESHIDVLTIGVRGWK